MMNRSRHYAALTLGILALIGGTLALRAQPGDPVALAAQLTERYDLLALEDGLGLVPHDRDVGFRLIEVRDGGVALNGEIVTSGELRERLGPDADLILRVTYLTVAEQRGLAGTAGISATAGAAPAGGASPTQNDPVPSPPARTRTTDGDTVRIGGSVVVESDELVRGDVVVIGGSADIDGEVAGDAVVIGGSMRLGPNAFVRGDSVLVGGSLDRDPAARVLGEQVGVGDFAQLAQLGRLRPEGGMTTWRAGGLVGTLLRVVLLALGALLVVTLGGRHVDAIAGRVAREPLRAGFVGFLGEVLFVPLLLTTVVVLTVSIIGIPLLLLMPFAVVLLLVVLLVGFTGVAAQVGRVTGDRFGLVRGDVGPHATVALGVATIVAVTLAARVAGLAGGFFGGVFGVTLSVVGGLIEYAAWTVGAGAVILHWSSTRRRGNGFSAPAAPAHGVAQAAPEMPTSPPAATPGGDVL
jgi:hypothetical protein